VKKTLLGQFSKDKGEYSSRLGIIIKEAKKTPGPGKYLGHTDWLTKASTTGFKFEKGSREFKPLNKVPAPNHYERKDVMTERPIAASEVQSQKKRTKMGKFAKGPKRNFLDHIAEDAKTKPAPGQYHTGSAQVLRNRLELHHGAPNFDDKKLTSKKAPPKADIAPNHYSPTYIHTEERLPNYSVPKALGTNYVDKAVRSKMLDKKTPYPGPGQNDLIDLSKVSRGTTKLMLGGLGRGTCSGYF
jgi:hypothetical protein